MTEPQCNAAPVSWLTLERFLLGELPPQRAEAVAAHLAACPACRASLAQLEADERPLPAPPPLPARSPTAVGWRLWPLALAGALAAAAAVLALLLWPGPPAPGLVPGELPPARLQVKGGELAIDLIRERAGQTRENPTRFAPGDRFRLLVTVPPKPGGVPWRVVVFQAGEAFFPLGDGEPLPGGNRLPLPGAFALDGAEPAVVCACVGRDLPTREELRTRGPAALPAGTSVCLRLEPVGE